jgi:hypothetical protein
MQALPLLLPLAPVSALALALALAWMARRLADPGRDGLPRP